VGVHAAVTTRLSGLDPQLGKLDGLTVRVMMLGWFDAACSVTGATGGLQVNESGLLPEPVWDENVMTRGLVAQVTRAVSGRADVK